MRGPNERWICAQLRATGECVDQVKVSTKELGEILVLSGVRISQLRDAGAVIEIETGVYDLGESVKGYVRFLRSRKDTGDKGRLTKARADLQEMEAARKAGQLVEVEKVTEQWVDAATRMKQKMLAVAPRAAPIVVTLTSVPEAHAAIESLVHEALAELSTVGDDGSAVVDPGIDGNTESAQAAA